MDTKILQDILIAHNQKIVTYNPIYTRITGSMVAAIVLQQAIYWWGAMGNKQYYKSNESFCDELAIGDSKFKAAKKRLVDAGFLQTEVRGVPATTWYTPNFTAIAEAMANYLTSRKDDQVENQPVVSRKSTSMEVENQPTITESTTENTREDLNTMYLKSNALRETSDKDLLEKGSSKDKDVHDPLIEHLPEEEAHTPKVPKKGSRAANRNDDGTYGDQMVNRCIAFVTRFYEQKTQTTNHHFRDRPDKLRIYAANLVKLIKRQGLTQFELERRLSVLTKQNRLYYVSLYDLWQGMKNFGPEHEQIAKEYNFTRWQKEHPQEPMRYETWTPPEEYMDDGYDDEEVSDEPSFYVPPVKDPSRTSGWSRVTTPAIEQLIARSIPQQRVV